MSTSLAKSAKVHATDLLERIVVRKNDIARAFYDIGVSLAELHEKKLYAALGYESFDAMLTDRDVMSVQYARRLIQVVGAFDRQQAQRLGPEKAYALVRYTANTKLGDDPAEYIEEGFPVVGGKRRPIDQVGIKDITAATRSALLKQKGQHGASEAARKAAGTVAYKMSAKLRARTDGEAAVRHVFKRGSWWLVIEVPVEMASAVR
jgi:hypothetical protein